MLKSYKVEINPTIEQISKINQSMGICRWLYNQYIFINQTRYKNGESFMSANDFDKYINNEIKILSEYKWINNCGSKARKKSMQNAETSYKRFFKKQSSFPKFKKKNKNNIGLYFPKNNKTDWTIERHRIKIPTFGWVRIKEFGYIPTNSVVKSGTISKKCNRYYVSILVEYECHNNVSKPYNNGIGIDLGIKDLAICSDGVVYKNINKTSKVKKLKKKLKREQRKLSRKYESLKSNKNKKEGVATCQNIQKQLLKVQKLHKRLYDIRLDYTLKTTTEIIKQNPSFITIEDLDVCGMMKNRHLSKVVQEQNFYEFRRQLEYKCRWNNIELRIVDRWYPSSKLCNDCGEKNSKLQLSDRTWVCTECGVIHDRDLNASYNLRDAMEYKVII